MSMFPHTVTLYATTENQVTFEIETDITILRGVLLDASKATNTRESGLETADSVNLYIPFDVEAVNGKSLIPVEYQPPKIYESLEDKAGYWTLHTGEDNSEVFFVNGAVVEPDKDFQYINANYDDVYRITSVDKKDFGGLKHWEVGGR